MFYEEKEISEFLKCPQCKCMFVDPRLLDCGESMCNDCIHLNLDTEKNGLVCICGRFHAMPENGFNKNQRLAKLVEIKPSEVSRSLITNEFKLLLNKIRELTHNVEVYLQSGKDKIREHCDLIRCDVDLISESWHQYIDKYRAEFMEKIREYEDECLLKYEKLFLRKQDYDEFISHKQDFYLKWSEYLKRFQIDDGDLTKASVEAQTLIVDLEDKNYDLRNETFSGRLLKFEDNENKVESSMLGRIKFQNVDLFRKQLGRLAMFELKETLSGFVHGAKFTFECLQNGNFIIAYHSASNNLNILAVDRTLNVIAQYNSIVPIQSSFSSYTYQHTYYVYTTCALKLFKTTDYIYLYYHLYCSNESNVFNLKRYNNNLVFASDLNLDFAFADFTSYDNQLFGLSFQNGSYGNLSIYDANLQVAQNMGQNNSDSPYFFAPTISKILVNQEYFCLFDKNNNNISLMNRNDGLFVKSFKIAGNSTNVFLYLNRHVLTYNATAKKLFSLNLQDERDTEQDIEKNSDNSELVGVSDKELIFFDSKLAALNF